MVAVRLAVLLMLAAAAFVGAAALVAATARPKPPPCDDTFIVETPVGEGQPVPSQPAPMCGAPEAPAWLVLGAGTLAGTAVVGGCMLLSHERPGRRAAHPATPAQRRATAPRATDDDGSSAGGQHQARAVC